ncbi:ParB/RepB/Spo0J family partition protein [Nocardioides sp. Root140]|uniref:ParB/RepB/Spo0J family partition protein n=1 Tax=Nocardioides sp. Root140 TaxID=1736460 RepID=UPI0006FB1781|nr:ParB N-terminal domain-containing protein [Nocardioides sp. Root140]KQY61420.1 hypothetical protein ASD30_25510 [Nocardioides sp. Root140]
MTTNSTTYEAGAIVHVAPTELLLQRNIREAKPSPDLIKSVKEVGVLEPITAVTTEAGDLLVRYGHRRTLAAVEAQATTVPVYVTGTDDEANEAEVLRVIAQRDENTHRAGLTTADEVSVVEQLAAFGLTAAQITKKARIKRADVDAALTVAGSGLARKATEKYDELTLDQAVTVAEFEDDPETAKALIIAAHEGQFDHVAKRARLDRATAAFRAKALAMLEDMGVRIIDTPGYNEKPRQLGSMKASHDATETFALAEHQQCPGHVGWVGSAYVNVDKDGTVVADVVEPGPDATDEEWDAYEAACDQIRATTQSVSRPAPVYGCEDPRKNGHIAKDQYGGWPSKKSTPVAAMSDEERAQEKQKRALVVENNKAWEAAEAVRRDWLQQFTSRKTPPKGTAAFLATALSRDSHAATATGGNALAADWLGTNKTGWGSVDLTPAKSATENRALVIVLVQVLAGHESTLTKDSWRHDGTTNAAGRYLRFIEAAGYTLSDVEKFAISKKTA